MSAPPPSVLWLDEITERDRETVGGKAAGLAALRQAGLAVPDGFVVPAHLDLAAARAAAAHAYATLGGAVAVRSSAAHEDGPELSFAGQYRSELDVQGAAAVSAAVARCRTEEGTGRAYAHALGAKGLGGLAVLVQRYVPARAAGVVFTRHPRQRDCVLIEAHSGAGEALVQGLVTPDRFVLERRTLAIREAPSTGSLSGAEAEALARRALAAEEALGGAQDVEWVIDRTGGIFLVQARPITVEEEPTPDPRVRRLTRANVGEVLPDPVTPLTWTTIGGFLEDAFRESVRDLGLVGGEDPPPFLVLHQQRLYLNLSLCLEVAQGIPGVQAADAEALVLGGSGAAAVSRSRRSWTSQLGALPRALRVASRAVREARRLPRRVAEAERRLGALTVPSAPADREALTRAWDDFLSAGSVIARGHVGASGASGVRLALLARLLGWLAPGDPRALVNRLVAGIDGVESAAPTAALEILAARGAQDPAWRAFLAPAKGELAGTRPPSLDAALGQFLAVHGHRALSEGELRTTTWADDPSPVLAALGPLLAAGRDPGFGRDARASARRADEEALRARQGFVGRAVLQAAIAGAQEWVRVRERTKSMSVRLVEHGRKLARLAAQALVAEGRLGQEDDVFFLTAAEVSGLLGGQRVSGPAVARRRRRHGQAALVPAPREIDLAAETPDVPEDGDRWTGLGVSAGIAVGKARVVDAGHAVPLAPGEILVAPVLDAAWGPQLAVAAGAVAEMGGMLSHGAVVARELGVPCVVDLPGATRRLRTGDTVRVDGSTGRVERLPEVADAGEGARPDGLYAHTTREDEAFHPLEPHPRARESIYLNVQDPAAGVALVASIGQRPGGRGEALLALALPDGSRLFRVALGPAQQGPAAIAVREARYSWEPLRFSFTGRTSRVAVSAPVPNPLALLLGRRTAPVQLALAFTPTTPPIDFTSRLSDEARAHLLPLGSHHIEQSGTWRGRLEVDGQVFDLAGTGSRDHSWGRREWAAADWWRLFTVRLGDHLAVHALVVSVRGHQVEGGFIWREGRAEAITRVQFREHRQEGRLVAVEVECASAAGLPLRLRGRVERTLTVPVELSRRPLRHLRGRPYALVLHENFTRYEAAGLVGHGMAEFTERA